jgi:hypothetical protein
VWSGDAVVHVSIVDWIKGEQPGVKKLFRQLEDNLDSVGTPAANTNYIDTSVQGGQTYYYVNTAIDSVGAESKSSTQVRALIPSP